VRWLRFLIGLLVALTLHSLLDSFFPNALAFFNPYVILVVYYSMGGNVFGAIIAGVIAGLVQDAYSGAMFGLHAFALTVCAYAVAYINSRLVLRGTLPFGACLIGAVVVNELVIYILVNILLKQKVEMFEQAQGWTDKLRVLQNRLTSAREELEAELKRMNPAWEAAPVNVVGKADALPLEQLERLWRNFAYLSRWSGQIQERIVQLSL